MATPFSNVYEIFLTLVNSSRFQQATTEAELSDDLIDYLKAAVLEFDSCATDLTFVGEEFTQDLKPKEKLILAKYMVLSWLSFHIKVDTLVKQALTDKDIRMTSQANHMNSLHEIHKSLKAEIQSDINKYLLKTGIFDDKA